MAGDPIHLGLEFKYSNGRSSSICDKLRFAQVLFDLVFDLPVRDNCIQWRFGRPGILPATAGPDPVSPIDLFDRILISDALCKCKRPTKLLLRLRTRDGVLTPRRERHSQPEQTQAGRTNKRGASLKNLTLRSVPLPFQGSLTPPLKRQG